MGWTAATAGWLAPGLPMAFVFLRARRPDLALGLLPFAAGLALLAAVLLSAWTAIGLAAQGWSAIVAGILLATLVRPVLRGRDGRSPRTAARPWLAGALGFLSVAALGAYHLFVARALADGPPAYAWDGYQIWLLHTKVLAVGSSFPAEMYSEPQLARAQWQYPLWLPVTLAWFMRSVGLGISSLHLPLGLLGAVLPLATYALLQRSLSPLVAASVALAPSAVPGLLLAHHGALADPTLVAVVTAGCACAIVGVIADDRPLMTAAGLCLACAVAVKNEGGLWVAGCGVCVAGLALHQRRPIADALRVLATVLLPSAGVFLVWDATCRHLGLANVVHLDASGFLERLPTVLAGVGGALWTGSNRVVLPLCLAAIPALLPGPAAARLRVACILVSLPLVYLVGIVAILALISIPQPYDVHWLLRTSIARLSYGVAPALFLSAVAAGALRAAAVRDRRASPGDPLPGSAAWIP